MGPRRKPVATCQALCLRTLENVVENYLKQITLQNEFPNELENHTGLSCKSLNIENLIEEHMKQIKSYLFYHTPRNLCSKISLTLIKALTHWLNKMTLNNNMTNNFTHELNDSAYFGLRMSELIANDTVEDLDLSQVPKQIRSCLYGSLENMKNLKYLNMGSGHGGWLSEAFCNKFYGKSMESLQHLVVLQFHHDCTNHLLGKFIIAFMNNYQMYIQ